METLIAHGMLCGTETPSFLVFDFSTPPPLLYYAYIPSVILALIAGCYILTRDRGMVRSRMFFGITVSFALWVLAILVQWVASYHTVLMFGWQLTALVELPMFLFGIAFIESYVRGGRSLPQGRMLLLVLLYLPVALLASTHLNISGYDFIECAGVVGPLWTYIYTVELVAVLWILVAAMRTVRAADTLERRAQIGLVSFGLALFLAIFFATNVWGELTKVYEINLVGPVGLVIFLGLVAYATARYQAFSGKLITSQVLVLALWILWGSTLFIQDVQALHAVIAVSFVPLVFVGAALSRSIRREVSQRNELQALTVHLQEVDKSKDEFLSFATHQMRSPLVSIKWGSETLLDESASGPLNDTQRMLGQKIHAVAVAMTDTVNDLLDISKIEQGGLVLKPEPVDLDGFIQTIVGQFVGSAQQKGLALSYRSTAPSPVSVSADQTKLRQVVVNLIDNSIKYTDTGTITVSLSIQGPTATVSVTDTGRGITTEDQDKLFGKFSRGKSSAANKGGSGLGLFLAKKIVEMHGGILSVTSPGEGQGSTFSFTIPLLK